MSLHNSLKKSGGAELGRSILTRTERIKWMMQKGLWKEDSKPFGMPKIKVIKLKAVKKEKKEDPKDAKEGTVKKPA